MIEALKETDQLSEKDFLLKIQKLEGYIRRAERRIDAHEKKLAKMREEQKVEIQTLKGSTVA